jgi:hypothetical protein
MATITKFASFEDHREAKCKVQNWYNGYQVVISEIKHSYGDGKIDSVLNAKRPEN